jgi:dTDP-4-amino-4,6-dideoxygalactose transaminase
VHLQPAYAHLGVAAGSLPNAEKAAATEISLPLFPELTDAQADEVIAAVKAVAAELA